MSLEKLEGDLTYDVAQLKLRFDFINNNLNLYSIKPLKIIFEAQPLPHIIFIETLSKPLGAYNPITPEMVKNSLV